MIGILFRIAIFTWLSGGWSLRSFAATNWSGGAYLGAATIQQPSSQYFLIGYSVQGFVEYSPAKAGISFTAIGRPPFSSSGYEDQDYGGVVELHKTVAERGNFLLGAGFGGGQMRGYIKSKDGQNSRSDFRMGGPSATIDLRYAGKKDRSFTAQLSHTVFPGLSTSAQTKAWVSWPWSIVTLGIGYRT